MKKTLIALAAVAATGAAFAQSSVTLYGVADVAVGKQSNVAADKFRAFAADKLNNGDSRFGLKGTEDLGAGLKANFNFEAGVNIANGATGTSGGNLFSRGAWVELAGGFGSLRAGRSLSPSFYGIAAYELTGTANYSSLVGQFGLGAGSRNDAMVAYTTPSLSGLTVTVGHVLAGNDANTTLAGNQSKLDLNAIYTAGPLTAAATYGKVQEAAKASTSFGGAYNFGSFKLAASYQDPADARKGFTIGATAPVGPVALTFDLARDTGSATKSTDYVLEAKYALSKRTFAYGVYHRDGSAKSNTVGVGVRHNF